MWGEGEGRGVILLLLTESGLPGSQLSVFIPQGESGQPILLRGPQLKPSVRPGEVDIMYPSWAKSSQGKERWKIAPGDGRQPGELP